MRIGGRGRREDVRLKVLDENGALVEAERIAVVLELETGDEALGRDFEELGGLGLCVCVNLVCGPQSISLRIAEEILSGYSQYYKGEI